MSKVLSLRLPEETAERLRDRARETTQSAAALAQRLVEEGLRMDAHPGIVFRGGPTGRRAALPRGPDVWEVVTTARSVEERGNRAVPAVAAVLGLPEREVRAALAYYGAHRDEVDERITANEHEQDRLRASWEAQQRLLA